MKPKKNRSQFQNRLHKFDEAGKESEPVPKPSSLTRFDLEE
ncbi:hypothetical protein J2S19_001104 [Metabacillus malikii]|uniref:Uncharacterized protein n=1 Tax=Metabacillus malikii TaxID=1504265 RepID=A0ABT9ZDD0_9BACI|nr:hypothetical protein [Metabacillus malikii]